MKKRHLNAGIIYMLLVFAISMFGLMQSTVSATEKISKRNNGPHLKNISCETAGEQFENGNYE